MVFISSHRLDPINTTATERLALKVKILLKLYDIILRVVHQISKKSSQFFEDFLEAA